MFLREIIAVLALSSPEPEVEIDEAALETIGDETIEVIERIPPGAESVVPGELLERTLPRQIERIETGGMTNLSGGWLKGRELVARNLLERGVNRVLLLTDGQANVGITDMPRLTGLAQQAKRERVTTTTIGFEKKVNPFVSLEALEDLVR